jgi:DNA primase
MMRDGLQLKFMFLPEGEDPDSLVQKVGKEAFEKEIAESLPLSEFFFETILAKADTRGLDGRARLLDLAKPYMAKLQAGSFKELMTARLAEMAQINPAALGQAPKKSGETRLEGAKKPATLSRKQMEAPSLVRKAITLLLLKPGLASAVEDSRWMTEADLPGVSLLSELIDFLHDRPHLTTASVLEHWRESPHARHLVQMASRELDLPEEGYEAEFLGVIEKIRKQGAEDALERLLRKSQYASLTPEEKTQLNNLLKGST